MEQLDALSNQISFAADGGPINGMAKAGDKLVVLLAIEEITGTVKQNAGNARQANQLAMGSRDTAERGGQVVTTAVAAMGEINQASKKIADIITTIDAIAFQTNLLALNAAVEAARAGEQGRGFAVVASEVRNLARRSASAAKEIKDLIQDSVGKIEAGSALVNQSGQTLGEIVESVKRVTDIIAEIAAASQEQSAGIDQVNRAVTQMDRVTQSNSAQAEQLTSTAQSLAAQAEELQALVARFKVEEGSAARRSDAAATPVAPARPTVDRIAPLAADRRVPAMARTPRRAPEPAPLAAHAHANNGPRRNALEGRRVRRVLDEERTRESSRAREHREREREREREGGGERERELPQTPNKEEDARDSGIDVGHDGRRIRVGPGADPRRRLRRLPVMQELANVYQAKNPGHRVEVS
jgi:ABC-type transporter Mla subunit MlaD